MVDRTKVEEILLQALEEIDTICIKEHQFDVHNVELIGLPKDIRTLCTYIDRCKRKHENEN